jgi:O-succinylbenzoic acid--CoA ligase
VRRLAPVATDDPIGLAAALRAALDGSGPAVLPLAPGAAVPPAAPARVPLPIAVVVATSGSSGAPKLVALPASALLASAAATESALGGPGEWVLALPGHYIAGIQVVIRSLTAGGEPHVVPSGPFTARGFAAAVAGLAQERRRYSALVPTQLHRVLDSVDAGADDVADAVRSLDALLIGGGRLPEDALRRSRSAGFRIVRTYGASETSGGCVYDGVPLAGVDVRIVDGEVQLSGAVLAAGYLGDEERTAATFLEEPGRRWYRTGDTGDWDGTRLTVTGRLDDVVITGGEKVSLALVERVVQSLPGLADAVVVRAADPEWGEVPVVATAASGIDLAVVRDRVAERLGRAAAPRRLLELPGLPLLANGKPDRVRITALARTGG